MPHIGWRIAKGKVMRIAVIGAGAIGGLVGREVGARRATTSRSSCAARTSQAIRRDGFTLVAADGSRGSRAQRRRRPTTIDAAGRARRGDPRHEGAPGRGRGEPRAAAPRARLHDRHHAERHPVLVLPRSRRTARRARVAHRGSLRRMQPPSRRAAHHRLRGLSRLRARGAGRGAAHRGRALPVGELDGSDQRARHRDLGSLRRAPDSRRRSCPTSAPRSGSSSGATSPSIRSARSPGPRSRTSASTVPRATSRRR